MKNIIALLLVAVMLLGIFGCASTDTNRGANAQPTVENGTPSPEVTAPSKVGGDTGEPSPEATATSKTGGDTGEPSPEATHTGTSAETGGIISEEAAWQIALEHAGLTKDQVTNARVVLEKDDGKLEYEVEFHQGTVEFDYDIDAATGEILSFDRDDD